MKQSFLVRLGLVMIGLAVVLALAGFYATRPERVASSLTQAPQDRGPSVDSQLREVDTSEVVQAATSKGVSGSSRRQPRSQSGKSYAEASFESRELLARIVQMDLRGGAITPEWARRWKDDLDQLVKRGPDAVPAIREFLDKNQDVNFGDLRGGILLQQPSLRTALINALNQIGGSEAQGLMVETLGNTTVPFEIALISRYLEEQAPGQYREQALQAARDVLGMASKGELPGIEVGPIFSMLRNSEEPTTASTVQALESQYKFYSTLTLSQLSGGKGVEALVRDLQDPVERESGRSDFTYQMLAQAACSQPQAVAALVAQAQQGQIPESAWRKIIAGLSGDQYEMISVSADGRADLPAVPGLKTFHVQAGNQNLYTVPLFAVVTPEQLSQRRAVIDQLIPLVSSAEVLQALREARANLSGLMAKK